MTVHMHPIINLKDPTNLGPCIISYLMPSRIYATQTLLRIVSCLRNSILNPEFWEDPKMDPPKGPIIYVHHTSIPVQHWGICFFGSSQFSGNSITVCQSSWRLRLLRAQANGAVSLGSAEKPQTNPWAPSMYVDLQSTQNNCIAHIPSC